MSLSTLIAGAPESVGEILLWELERRQIPVRLLTWVGDDVATRLRVPGSTDVVEIKERNGAELDRALLGIDKVVLLSTSTPDQVVRHGSVVEAIERSGRPVHLIPVLLLGALPADAPLQLARWHAVTEAQIRSASLPTTTVRTQILMQNLLRTAPSIRNDSMICGSFGDARLPHVDARDVAAVVAQLVETEGYAGKSYVLTGPQAMSYAEVAGILSDELGRPIQYLDMAIEVYHEHLVGIGIPMWRADDLSTLARLFRSGHEWAVSSAVTELTGQPARTLQQFIREHAAEFQPQSSNVDQNGTPMSYLTPF